MIFRRTPISPPLCFVLKKFLTEMTCLSNKKSLLKNIVPGTNFSKSIILPVLKKKCCSTVCRPKKNYEKASIPRNDIRTPTIGRKGGYNFFDVLVYTFCDFA